MPLELAAAPTRRRLGVGFDWQVVGVTALPWGLFLTLHVLSSNPGPILLAGAFLGGPHILATVGLYLEPGLRSHVGGNRTAFLIVPLAVAVASAVAFVVSPDWLVRVLLSAFLLWQTHHFTKQNFGMFVFWARARGLDSASLLERRLVLATSAIGMTGILRLVDPGSVLDTVMRGAGLVAIVGCAIAVFVCTDDPRRRAALLMAVAFYAPLHVFEIGLLGAALSYQAAHGAQYFLMVGKATRPTRKSLAAFVLFVLIAGSVVIQVGMLDPFGSAAGIVGLYKGIVAAHFIVDGRFWRLRDKPVRDFMRSRFEFL